MARHGSVVRAAAYGDIGAYGDTHEMGGVWDQTRSAGFEVDIRAELVHGTSRPRALADGVCTVDPSCGTNGSKMTWPRN